MIPESLNITWHSPKSSTKLVNITLNEDIDINGYIVPKGFTSNGGTVPLFARLAVNPLGEGLPCFIAHDHKLGEGYIDSGDLDIPLINVNQSVSRKQADDELYRDLVCAGVNMRMGAAIYFFVNSYAKLRGRK